MIVWYETIWLRYIRKRTKEIGFHKSLNVMDAFKAHFTEDAAATMLIGHTGIVKVPAGCTSKVKTLDVCIKKPFRSILRKYWEEYVVKVVKNAGNEGMKP